MTGDSPHEVPTDAPAADTSPIHCPVHRVEITPCDASELAPLLAHLGADHAVQSSQRFARGTLIEDGRLDLCKQSIGAENCLQVTRALRSNSQVRSLMLGTNAIGDVGAQAVAQLATVNPVIEVLYLGCNNIGPEGAEHLQTALAGESSKVTGLWLKRNPLGPDGAARIAHILRGSRNLRVLDLVNTDLRDEGLLAVVEGACTGIAPLQFLYLSGNTLGPSAAASLSRLLREAPHLRGLYLSVNRLMDQGAMLIAQALDDNNTLQTLELASNGIGPQGAKALFSAASRHASLQRLNLGHAPSTKVLGASANQLLDDGARHAAGLLAGNATLRELDLSRNGITDHGMDIMAQAMESNTGLTRLVIDRPLPEAITTQLARNRSVHGSLPVQEDRALIRSVYR
ncbi:leucine-rich repeat domain-containing protein [Piscinibacter terrae]|uniref:Ribonuclease inhibitor n=1 Tax=Piscinibacter terrae TaxID=2496871 RepID=A0A3N7HH85_9BURK|nr:ribonuclease inhibitor [Albitalea terrae]RQP21397.1 ribonuclease inhibitor [Albitalea terrae]